MTDALWQADPEALVYGGSHAPDPLLQRPCTLFPTSLRYSGEGTSGAAAITQVPLTLRRGGRTIARLESRCLTLSTSVPVSDGWFMGWRYGRNNTSGCYRDGRDETMLDGASHEASLALAWCHHDWNVGAALTSSDLGLSVFGSGLDDFLGTRPGEGLLSFDLDSSPVTFAVERERGNQTWGAQYCRRPADGLLQTMVRRDLYLAAWDGTERCWQAWYAQDRGDRRWFVWAATSSHDSGEDPLAAYPVTRGRLHTSFDARTVAIGTRQTSPDATTRIELSYQHNDLALDAWMDQGVLAGGIMGRYIVDGWADVDTLALRMGRSRRFGRWRADWGLSVMHCGFDAYGHYIDTGGLFQPVDDEWEQLAQDAGAWVFSVTTGAGYRTRDWELAGSLSVLGAVADVDFEDLLPPAPPPPPPPHPPPQPPPPPAHRPSPKASPGWIAALSWTWFL